MRRYLPILDWGRGYSRATLSNDLIAALSDAATWQRRGDFITLLGAKPLRFRINTN